VTCSLRPASGPGSPSRWVAPDRRWTTRSPRRSTSTLEFELLRHRRFGTRLEARRAVAEWIDEYNLVLVPCVLMRAGTSRGPFFLREWLPADERARDEALIGAIGASDLLQLDGVGEGSTLTSKVAIVSPSEQPGCDVDYLFAQDEGHEDTTGAKQSRRAGLRQQGGDEITYSTQP
jgi:hypothetical protein